MAWRSFGEPFEQPFQPRHAFPKVADVPAHVAYFLAHVVYFPAYAVHLLAHGPLAWNDDGRQGDGGSDDGQDNACRGYEIATHGSTLLQDREAVKVEVHRRPPAVSRYFWFLWVGDSGWVISTSPADMAGRR